ncbi:enoyl-ACP reductase FabV [Coxiella endosymbiont of Amblyomma americanum]|uniref:enoyl-ACP reductase FabV n=1 Tax=Coxiella endosymbiont of Amblyomma americanum TaxID=325775 RepID=UPI00057E8CED|nr:enoyl-ACP reductase FabV [Coxiella endosymbiont of Amblyomma americanum]AJC50449.1 trans-2-enoyl-CoA reductase [Coxiella endosymbiont of Amblyomma americanum]AUJ58789.1 trans-2-enoyl-CoA reductase [Coxiella-like endosymbiont of Amblyomma americanum]
MVVVPKIRGFVCVTAHPEGCERNVMEWIEYVKKKQTAFSFGPKRALIIGASTGFGLASRIVAAFGGGAKTIGVFLEKSPVKKRTASPGWYNVAAFEKAACALGLYVKSINGDAFSNEVKRKTIELIRKDWKNGVDLVVYSIAAPRRVHPKTGEVFNSVLKPIRQFYRSKTVDIMTGKVSEIIVGPATEKEIQDTKLVMGGDDWALWITALLESNCLSRGIITVAFTYIGPELTYAIYRNGTIGKAKQSLEATAKKLDALLKEKREGRAVISVNKALVTQASVVIPAVPLYVSLLYKVMKRKSLHEGCIEQMLRLFSRYLYGKQKNISIDLEGRVRIDDLEMRRDVQEEVTALWQSVNSNNVNQIADITGYREDFYKLFGFGLNNIDYQRDVDTEITIPSISSANL